MNDVLTLVGKHTWMPWAGSITLITLFIAGGLWLLSPAPTVEADSPRAPLAQTSPGQQIYEQRCAACHSIDGDGAGPGAEHLTIKPRDFTRDEYKIKSTEGEEFPTREDIIGVIANGMPGSSMPAWQGFMSEAEMGQVADYIQTFGRFFPQDGYGTTVIDIPARPDPTTESIARGAELYSSDIGCARCHGDAGRGDGPSAFELTDNAGFPIFPADLTQPHTFRGGSDPEDIYLRLRTGLTGSPMASFADALSEDQTWDLVNFILSLFPEEPVEPAVLLVSHLVDGPLPESPDDPAWDEAPEAYYPLTGQLMRVSRYFQLAINAVRVKSLYNGSDIAFHVAWNDRTETRDSEAIDAMAIQFPQELVQGDERPYFVFGDSNRPVYQWYWSADSDTVVERNATGLDAIEDQPEAQWQTSGTAAFENGRWQVVFRRSLGAGDDNDLGFVTDRFIPISFVAWEGLAGETGNKLGITTWSVVFLETPTPLVQYARIPIVMVIVLVVELVIVWVAQRTLRRPNAE
jgi:DMSO reductase family type II enzyme heme b subunit